MITNSNSKHVTNVVNGGSYSPTGAYTVKQGVNTKRSSSTGREGYPASLNTVNSVDSYHTLGQSDTSYANVHPSATNHPNNNNISSIASTSYANMSFLDYQARKANLSTSGSGQRSPVRRNSANIDTSRNYNGVGGNGGNSSVGVSLLGGEEENHLNGMHAFVLVDNLLFVISILAPMTLIHTKICLFCVTFLKYSHYFCSLTDQTAPLLSSVSTDSNHHAGHPMPLINSAQQSVPPLGLSGPMLPLSLQAQQVSFMIFFIDYFVTR